LLDTYKVNALYAAATLTVLCVASFDVFLDLASLPSRKCIRQYYMRALYRDAELVRGRRDSYGEGKIGDTLCRNTLNGSSSRVSYDIASQRGILIQYGLCNPGVVGMGGRKLRKT
jgi:hypothetical protein